jgi:hypothetical protein
MSRLVAICLLGLSLSGCMTLLYLADRPSGELLADMKRRCEQDAELRWFGERPKGIDLWMPGDLSRDPVDDPMFQTASPYNGLGNGEGLWLRTGVARALYINMLPGDPYYFGPSAGEPRGIYKFELLPDGDPRCADEMAWYARGASRGLFRANAYVGQCLAYSFVGEAPPNAGVFVRFKDEPLRARGLYRSGERLFIDGELRAAITDYWAINPSSAAERSGQWGIKACQHKREQGYVRFLAETAAP